MNLAFSKPTSNEEERYALFSQFSSVGYDGLQLKKGQYSEYLDEPSRFLEEWRHYPGVASSLIVGGKLDEPGVSSLRKLFEFARSVESERIVFCHTVSRWDVSSADIKDFAKTLSELGKEAQQSGLKLSLHHHYDQPVMYRNDFDLFFNAVEDQAVSLTVDTAHLVKSGIEDIASLIRDFRYVIDNVHVKDFAGGEFKVLGEGYVDFAPVFSAIQEIGFDDWICADEESGSGLSGSMQSCRQFITARISGLSLETPNDRGRRQ